MSSYRVIFKRVVSEDGRAIAEASSQVITSGNSGGTIAQSVTVHVSTSNSNSASSSSSSDASSSPPS